jgi:predicted unusual protein kinase regulating ubiquinone biosynthesis (AarF/ABC1/UbiB family)
VRSLSRAIRVGSVAARLLAGAGVYRLLGRWPRLARRLGGPLTGPQRLKAFFERSGGAFIKLGQLLALQPDMLPLRYCNELYDLMDHIDPCPYEDIEAVFTAELGRTPDQAFDRFDHTALSTASIGQVHVAWKDGRKYAVKVRRKGADEEFAQDIRLLDGFVRLLERLRAERLHWVRQIVNEFIDWTSEELDYRQEARYQEEIRRNHVGDPRCRVPSVEWDLTTRRTLVVEYLEGTTVLDLLRSLDAGEEGLLRQLQAQGYDHPTTARTLLDVFLRDAFVHGIFHADLHPANLLIMSDNVVGYVDFGITGLLSGAAKDHLANLTIAWTRGDIEEMCETFFMLAQPPSEAQKEAYREGLVELAAEWYQPAGGQLRLMKSFSIVNLEMLGLSHRTGIMPHPAVARYLRSATAADGLIKRFSPGFDVGGELEAGCRRYLTKLQVDKLFSFENVASWSSLVERLLRERPTGGRAAGTAGPHPRRRSHPTPGSAQSRALPLALVALAFAALGATFPGDLLTWPSVPAAALGVSAAASVLLLGLLRRRRR